MIEMMLILVFAYIAWMSDSFKELLKNGAAIYLLILLYKIYLYRQITSMYMSPITFVDFLNGSRFF